SRPSISSTRSPGSKTPRSTSRSYSTRFHRFSCSSGMSESSDPRRRPSMSPGVDGSCRAIDGATPRHAPQIRKRRALDPVAPRLHGPGLEAEPPDRRGVAVEPVIGVAYQRVEGLGMGTLDAAQKILASGDIAARESPGFTGRLHSPERLGQQGSGFARGSGHRQDVLERQRAALGKCSTRRHQGVEHHAQEVALRRELRPAHARLRIIPSATYRATAWMVEVGFTPALVTMTLPSTMYRLGTSWHRPSPSTTEVAGSLPMRAVPIR